MPIGHCHHCQASIVDYSSVVEVRDQIYCCRNCLIARRGAAHPSLAEQDVPTCVRCASAIIETESLVERHSQRFCCYNCAAAALHDTHLLAA